MSDHKDPSSFEDDGDYSVPSLQPVAQEKKRRRKRGRNSARRRIERRLSRIQWFYIAVLVIAVVALIVVASMVAAVDAQNRVDAAWISLSRVVESISTSEGTELTFTDFERMQSSLWEMSGSLARADSQTRILRPLGRLNNEIAALFDVMDAGRYLVNASNATLNGVEPTLFFLAGGETDDAPVVQISSGERIVELLELGRSRFLDAQESLKGAEEILINIDLDGVSSDIFFNVESLKDYYGFLSDTTNTLLQTPELLTVAMGLDEEQNYLVLAQNSDELRPSGGYISTYGWMQVGNGRVLNYDYQATTATTPNPPDALAENIALPDWWIQYGQPVYAAWDGSWYADFSETAEMAAWYYDAGNNPMAPIDAVISIDIRGFEYIMEGLGSVVVPDYEVVVTAQNFREVVYEIRAGDAYLEHKRFVAALYKQILEDWQNVDREQSTELMGALLQAVMEKHILLYFRHEGMQQLVEDMNWAGEQAIPLMTDYLMVADANLGSKSNRSISRSLTYDVEIQPDDSLESRLTVAYDFPASVAELDPAVAPEHYNDIDYHNLVQVFTPAGGRLVSWDNVREPVVVDAGTHTGFVVNTEVPYNTGERFQFVYESQQRVSYVEDIGEFKRYTLVVQKQAGMLAELVTVQVSLPEGAQFISANPQPVASYDFEQPVLEFRVDLLTDQRIEVIFAE